MKIPITYEDLCRLAKVAQANGTQDAFIVLALDWAEQISKEVARLEQGDDDDDDDYHDDYYDYALNANREYTQRGPGGFVFTAMRKALADGYTFEGKTLRCYLIAQDYPASPADDDVSSYRVLDGSKTVGAYFEDGIAYPTDDVLHIDIASNHIRTVGGEDLGPPDPSDGLWLKRALVVDDETKMPVVCIVVTNGQYLVYGTPCIMDLILGSRGLFYIPGDIQDTLDTLDI